ncbi:hypothetical protein H1Q78_00160 [Cellulosimicrobium cellulans]|uniref:hypothetical protein n=1 Tax=Cellulosimicrobium cellulans TaxID=1710 RepID=UPI001EDBFF87|nr:hypothetical protein [Cellulosimicrobium cellulans]UKJ63954.1 hypothetical protein H1Q78_00160 [Cellulosimicrobium cellulans]
MTDLATLTDDEIRNRYGVLYARVQQAGCPRDVVLAFDAVSDELGRRQEIRPSPIVCSVEYSDEETDDQPPGPEWGA